jgi:hypothetical protein
MRQLARACVARIPALWSRDTHARWAQGASILPAASRRGSAAAPPLADCPVRRADMTVVSASHRTLGWTLLLGNSNTVPEHPSGAQGYAKAATRGRRPTVWMVRGGTARPGRTGRQGATWLRGPVLTTCRFASNSARMARARAYHCVREPDQYKHSLSACRYSCISRVRLDMSAAAAGQPARVDGPPGRRAAGAPRSGEAVGAQAPGRDTPTFTIVQPEHTWGSCRQAFRRHSAQSAQPCRIAAHRPGMLPCLANTRQHSQRAQPEVSRMHKFHMRRVQHPAARPTNTRAGRSAGPCRSTRSRTWR